MDKNDKLREYGKYRAWLDIYCAEHHITYKASTGTYEFIHDGILYKLEIAAPVKFTGQSKNVENSRRVLSKRGYRAQELNIKHIRCARKDIIEMHKKITQN